jgi:hypothetical protein
LTTKPGLVPGFVFSGGETWQLPVFGAAIAALRIGGLPERGI